MKKNIRKIPPVVRDKLKSLIGRDIVAGCTKQFSVESIRNGVLAHLQIELRDDGLYVPASVLPLSSQGKYSARNIEGYEVIRKDLPIETHYHTAVTPNWGDSYYGTHDVSLPHQAYPRDFYPPRELTLSLYCPDNSGTRSTFLISAKIDEVISQTATDFEDHLLEDLNLLQENVGCCGVEAADSSIEEYVRTLHLSWEILPSGSRDDVINRLFQGRSATQQQYDNAGARYDFFKSLNPRQLIVGTSGFRRYFGAMLEANLVVFENIEYGNAIYVMYDNWETISRRSRLELLTGRLGNQFDRVVHRGDWQTEVRLLVEAKR